MKIPFSIDYRPQVESGEYKVETNLKEPVTIIKWDLRNDDGNILCYYFDGKEEIPYVTGGKDLFIVTTEPELSEFEHAFGLAIVDAPELEEKEEWYPYIKEKAAELLERARKELREELQTHEDHVDSFMGLAISSAYERGKAEALKDLPRWRYKKGGTGPILNDCLVLNKYGCICKSPSGALLGNVWILEYDELAKLPKED